MIQLPLFSLPFPPSSIILYRVLQCTHGLGHHPSMVLELARRRIVDLWDHDAPIFGAPIALVDVGKQCIWLFAVVEETEQSMIGTFWHDGLEGTFQICYTYILTMTSDGVQRPSKAPTHYRNFIPASLAASRRPSHVKTVLPPQPVAVHPHFLPSSLGIPSELRTRNFSMR